MNAIIRPAPQVFQRTLPLMLVFGAFEATGTRPPASLAATAMIRDTLETARRYRWPLAFWRRVEADGSTPEGHWLPGCRPRVTDRVFEGRSGSPLQNRELRSVIMRPECTDLYALGLPNDSDLDVLESGLARLGCRLVLVTEAKVLQNCSGLARIGTAKPGMPVHALESSQICHHDWKKCLRTLE